MKEGGLDKRFGKKEQEDAGHFISGGDVAFQTMPKE